MTQADKDEIRQIMREELARVLQPEDERQKREDALAEKRRRMALVWGKK